MKLAFDLNEAAEAVPYSVDHLRRQIRAGLLAAKKDSSGKYVITAKALEAWLETLPDFDAEA